MPMGIAKRMVFNLRLLGYVALQIRSRRAFVLTVPSRSR